MVGDGSGRHNLVNLLEIINLHGDFGAFDENAIFMAPLSTEFLYPRVRKNP